MVAIREGPPRYFCPICVRTQIGFVGGPSGYLEVTEAEKDRGPIIKANPPACVNPVAPRPETVDC